MSLIQELLTPIGGDNPAGIRLRYDPVYDQIKEARKDEDSSLSAGDWARQPKRADYDLVIKIASNALATQSKDLQLAVWLGEALIKRSGISALAPALRLCLELQQRFWETLYPEIDEGDLGMRVAPLQWSATNYASLVYETSLTSRAINVFQYKAARLIKREAGVDYEKQNESGALTTEDVDEAVAATPVAFYVTLNEELSSADEVLHNLELYCEERYRDDGPSFRQLRQAIAEVQNIVSSLLREKQQSINQPKEGESTTESNDGGISLSVTEHSTELPIAIAYNEGNSEGIVSTPARLAQEHSVQSENLQGATPESWDDAQSRIEYALAYMTSQEPSSPLPFMLCSSMRFVELYNIVASQQYEKIKAPSSELRQSLKKGINSGDWMETYRQSFAALSSGGSVGWLDPYRYLWMSCRELGWSAQQKIIIGTLQLLLREIPSLPNLMLSDDTPTANADTVRWLAEEIDPCPTSEYPVNDKTTSERNIIPTPLPEDGSKESTAIDELFVTARSLAANGHVQDAIQLLIRDATCDSTGRLRYHRNLQIAELCMQSGNSTIAIAVLQDLVREVEDRRLEEWEGREVAARPYVFLLNCAQMIKFDRMAIFTRLCTIDPSIALMVIPQQES